MYFGAFVPEFLVGEITWQLDPFQVGHVETPSKSRSSRMSHLKNFSKQKPNNERIILGIFQASWRFCWRVSSYFLRPCFLGNIFFCKCLPLIYKLKWIQFDEYLWLQPPRFDEFWGFKPCGDHFFRISSDLNFFLERMGEESPKGQVLWLKLPGCFLYFGKG